MHDRITAAASTIRAVVPDRIDIGLVLGTGLGELPDGLQVRASLPYEDIDGFPQSTAPGHAGNLVYGEWADRRIICMQGRFHLYEGWSAVDTAMPAYVLSALGANTLIVTNSAGGLRDEFAPGDVMLIDDHLNFTGQSPLIGAHDSRLGPRFPDLSDAYSRVLRDLSLSMSERVAFELHRGVYGGVVGPQLETSAERRYYRHAGADAIGMSTIMEVIAGNHCGMNVLGLSAITNKATGGPDQKPDTIEEVVANAAIAGKKIKALLGHIVAEIKTV